MNVPQRVAFNTLVQLAGRTVSIALTLVSFAIVARYLGVAGFGAYSLVLTFLMLTVAVADLGLTPIGVRELSTAPERARQLIGHLLALRVLVAAAAALVLLAIAPLVPYEDRVENGLLLTAAAAFALVLTGIPTMVFQSRLRLDQAMLVEVATSATTLVLVVAAVAADLGFSAVVLASVGGALAATVVGFVLAARLLPLTLRFERDEARRLLAAALPVAVYSIFGILHFKIDTVLLSLLKPLRDVGTYSVAYRFLEQVLFVPGFFVAAVFPIIAAYRARGDERLRLAIDKSFAFLVMVAVPVAAATFVLADDVVRLVAGEDFDDAVTPLRVLVFASLFIFTNALFSSLLVIFERERSLAAIVGAALAVNVLLNLVLIPPFSYTGAAVATVVTEALGGGAMMAWALRHSRVPLDLTPVPRVFAATAGAVLVLWATLELPFAVTVLAGAAAYVALAYLLGVVTRNDLALLLARPARQP